LFTSQEPPIIETGEVLKIARPNTFGLFMLEKLLIIACRRQGIAERDPDRFCCWTSLISKHGD